MPVGNYQSGFEKPDGTPLPRIPRDTFSGKKKKKLNWRFRDRLLFIARGSVK